MSRITKENINSLLQNGRMNEARKLCKLFCKKNENDAEAWFILGSIYGQTNKYNDAIKSLLRSISIQNNVAIAHHNLGLVYLRAGKPVLARSSFEEALKLEPNSPATRLELANALQVDGAPDDAIPIYEDLLKSAPSSPPVLSNLAAAYTSTGKHVKAINCYRKLLELQGNSAETLFMLGNVYRSAGKPDDAEASYRSALQIKPDSSGLLNNLGLALHEQGLYKDAEEWFNKSLDIEPHQSDAYINMARCCLEQRRTADARVILERALELHPGKPEEHWELSLVLLKLGQFEEGWREYEWRLKNSDQAPRTVPLPTWQGENITNKTILVTAEQGIGDEIMFSSCFPDIAKRAARVVIDCEDRLTPLFRRSFPDCDIRPGKQSDDISQLGSLSGIDVNIAAGSIPQYLRKHKHEFPKHQGYLSAGPDDIEKWRTRYNSLDEITNVGISWKGGHISQMKKRSTQIKDWLPVLKVAGINFINLQYGEVQSEIDTARDMSGTIIHHWQDSDPLMDLDDFAAQISALDLIISVDNSTVHLAGALGVKTWILQPYSPDWRWLDQAENSYWYPAVTQLHPTHHGEWKPVLSSVASKLISFVESC